MGKNFKVCSYAFYLFKSYKLKKYESVPGVSIIHFSG